MKKNNNIFAMLILCNLLSPYLIIAQNIGIPPVGTGGLQGLGGISGSTQIANPNIPANPSNPSDPSLDDRYVYWVHGLNGSNGSWSPPASWSQSNYKIVSVTDIEFPMNLSIEGAGDEIRQDIKARNNNHTGRDFIIAHSLGGMATRFMMKRSICDGRNDGIQGINGYVTFGSFHQGVELLKNKKQAFNALNDICKVYGKAYAYQVADISGKYLLPLFGSIEIFPLRGLDINLLTDTICGLLETNVFEPLLSSLTPNAMEGLEAGSAKIQSLNQPCDGQGIDSLHKVAFFGVEDTSGLMFRTLKYFRIQAASAPVFSANLDQDWVTTAQKNYKELLDAEATFKHRHLGAHINYTVNFCDKWPYKTFNYCIKYKRTLEFYERALAATEEALKLSESMDEQYKSLIGAVTYVPVNKYNCICENKRTGNVKSRKVDNPSECVSSQYWDCNAEEHIFYERKTKDSDGVVLAESAMALPNATNPPQYMLQTSHMQMRNNLALRLSLETTLYEGNMIDRYFETRK